MNKKEMKIWKTKLRKYSLNASLTKKWWHGADKKNTDNQETETQIAEIMMNETMGESKINKIECVLIRLVFFSFSSENININLKRPHAF